jgi:hypothetical protein
MRRFHVAARFLVSDDGFQLKAEMNTAEQIWSNETRHQLSGGAQGPGPEQLLLQDGPPDGGQLPPMASGTML